MKITAPPYGSYGLGTNTSLNVGTYKYRAFSITRRNQIICQVDMSIVVNLTS